MARIQILELPEGSSDDRPPFVLVVDETAPQRVILGADTTWRDHWQDIAATIGARGVIVTPETVDIPANDTSAYLGAPTQETTGSTCQYCSADCTDGRSWDGGDLYACPSCSDGRAKLNQHKAAVTDALGMDRTRDWDDIRNAAAGLRSDRDALAAEVERLRAGEEPAADKGVVPTPAQWIWKWNRATPEKRLDMAAQILDGMSKANTCFMADHETQIAHLRAELDRLLSESAGATNPDA